MNQPVPEVPAAYPLRSGRIWSGPSLLWAAALGLPTGLLYLLSLAPAVGWWDSGELLACARTLSVAHRPGFPLYVVFGRMAYGWLSDPRWLANAVSAAAAATALVFVWRSLCLLAGDRPFVRVWVALGGFLVAASPVYFRQAVRIEVYAPVYACLACALLLAAAAQRAPDPRAALRRFLACVYLLSLAFCLHSAVTAPVAVAVASLFAWGRFRPSFKHWCLAAASFALGLSVYLYVPLRAPWAPYVWGQPDHLSGLFAYFSASDAHGIIAREASGTLSRIFELCGVLWQEAAPVLLCAGLAGLLWSVVRKAGMTLAPLLLALSGLLVAASVVSLVIRDNADMHAYLVPVLWAAWWGWAQLAASWREEDRRFKIFRAARVAVPVLVLAAIAVQLQQGLRAVRPVRLGLSDAWGAQLLAAARPGDLLIIQDANTDFLLRGLSQTGAGVGVTVLNAALAESEWYRAWWQSRQTMEIDASPASWTRRVAQRWQDNGGRVLVDYGAPGFAASELAAHGMVCLWAQTPPTDEPGLPVWRPAGAEEDPEWVRSAVWFYYRLALHHRERGEFGAALRACEQGLTWAPDEEVLMRTRAELASEVEMWGAVMAQPTSLQPDSTF